MGRGALRVVVVRCDDAKRLGVLLWNFDVESGDFGLKLGDECIEAS